MELYEHIDQKNLPTHIAIIMDGNGRWAKAHGKPRVFGHRNGVKAVRDTVEGAAELGIQYLTLFAFSAENWNRPKIEVNALMELLVSSLKKEAKTLMKNNIKLKAIGRLENLPKRCKKELDETIELTKDNDRMTLILALSYSSQWEITNAIQQIATDVKDGVITDPITEETVSNYLETKHIPNPELLVRTSGEKRISNFLLWQIAYAELYFTETLWPDFRRENLYEAIIEFQHRERRFGLTSEQLLTT